MMGGKINVQSEYGKGSLFVASIPQKISKQSAPLNEIPKQEVTSAVATYENKKALIVDDNDLNIKVTKRFLTPYKLDIDECHDGQECLNKIKQGNKYDIILMDIMMPVRSGETALQELKKIDGFNMPTVALTADATVGSKEKYLSQGFIDYISKPFNKKQLDILLKKVFSNNIQDNYKMQLPKATELLNNEKIIQSENKKSKEEYLKEYGFDLEKALEMLGDIKMYDETIKIGLMKMIKEWCKLKVI